MPHLIGDGTGKVILDSMLLIGGTTGDYVEVEARIQAGAFNDTLFFIGNNEDTNNFIQMTSAGIKFRAQSGSNAFVDTGFSYPTEGSTIVVRAEKVASGYDITIDGVSIGIDADSLPLRVNQFFATGASGNVSAFDLFRVSISTDGGSSVTNEYLPINSGGTGSNLPDSVGSAEGSLVGFPTDDSQWGGTYPPVTGNQAPNANAGVDQSNVLQGSTVTLDSSLSSDSDGNIASRVWTQTAGTTVALSDATAVQPTFTAPNTVETLTFQVEVTDNNSATAVDTVNIQIVEPSSLPVANAGPDQSAISGETFKLNADQSNTADGFSGASTTEDVTDLDAFQWTQTGGPAVTLNDSTWARPSFTAPTVTVDTPLTFELVVTHNGVDSLPDEVVITVKTAAALPTANATASVTSANAGEVVTLSADSSTANTSIVKRLWKQVKGAYAPLSDIQAGSPQLTMPSADNKNTFAQDIYGTLPQSTPSALDVPLSIDKFYDMTYLGAFRVDHFVNDDLNSSISTGNIAYNPVNDSIYLAGRQSVFGEFGIPTLNATETVVANLPAATVRQTYVDIFAQNTFGNTNDTVTGALVFNGQLIVNTEQFYGGDNPDSTQLFADADDITQGNTGLFQLEGAAKVAGWMYPIPAEHQTKLGGAYLVGNAGNYSRNSRYSIGPASLSVFDPQDILDADITTNRVISATPLMQFSNENPITDRFTIENVPTDPLWTQASRSHGAFILPDTNFYLAFGYNTGLNSGIDYKGLDDDGTFVGGYQSIDPTDRNNFFWMFDLDEILAAQNLYDPRPFAMGAISHPFDDGAGYLVNGATYDFVNERLFISLDGAGAIGSIRKDPLIVVYDFKAKTTPDTTVTSDLTDMVFEVEVTDSEGLKSTDTVTVALNSVSAPTDTTTPVLTANPATTQYNLTAGDSFTPPAVTVNDTDANGNPVTATVTPTIADSRNGQGVGDVVYTYNYTDGTNPATPIVVTVSYAAVVDTTAPIITVSGNATTTIPYNGTVPEFTASTDDGSAVVVGGDNVDNATAGTYTITFNATDAAGNQAAEVTRAVIVEAEAGYAVWDDVLTYADRNRIN